MTTSTFAQVSTSISTSSLATDSHSSDSIFSSAWFSLTSSLSSITGNSGACSFWSSWSLSSFRSSSFSFSPSFSGSASISGSPSSSPSLTGTSCLVISLHFRMCFLQTWFSTCRARHSRSNVSFLFLLFRSCEETFTY